MTTQKKVERGDVKMCSVLTVDYTCMHGHGLHEMSFFISLIVLARFCQKKKGNIYIYMGDFSKVPMNTVTHGHKVMQLVVFPTITVLLFVNLLAFKVALLPFAGSVVKFCGQVTR